MTWQLIHADCIEAMQGMDEASVDAIVTDPPYGLEFMGKEWDKLGRRQNHPLDPSMQIVKDSSAEPRAKDNPWQKEASGYGAPRKNARCRRCSRLRFSQNPCTCDTPDWDTRTAEYARDLQDWHTDWATEALRVLKPGGHLLAFGGTRTYHRLACALEDAGFEIRDTLAYMYGSGFPKSLDVSKAIDKRRDWTALPKLQAKVREARKAAGLSQSQAAVLCGLIDEGETLGGGGFMWFETGMRMPTREQYPRLKAALGLDDECDQAFEEAEREVVGTGHAGLTAGTIANFRGDKTFDITAPATPEAQQWQGWGTALKPAYEPIVLARKPLAGTVAQNVLEHGTGALNIDGCRIGTETITSRGGIAPGANNFVNGPTLEREPTQATGRWPANIALDETAAAMLDEQSGESVSRVGKPRGTTKRGLFANSEWNAVGTEHDDQGGASRFFKVVRPDGYSEDNVWHSQQDPAKPADNLSSPSSAPVGSVPSRAQLELSSDPSSQAPSTCATASASSENAESGTPATLTTGPKSSPASPPRKRTRSSSPARSAAPIEPTDTTTTTADPSTSVGSAEAVTSSTTSSSREAGVPDLVGSRLFYTSKASTAERNKGAEYLEPQNVHPPSGDDRVWDIPGSKSRPRSNNHPTVKPVDLMQWLCRLITPPGGTILDPFTGSGSTGIAALREAFNFIGIEREAEYVEIARARIIGDAPLLNTAEEVSA